MSHLKSAEKVSRIIWMAPYVLNALSLDFRHNLDLWSQQFQKQILDRRGPQAYNFIIIDEKS